MCSEMVCKSVFAALRSVQPLRGVIHTGHLFEPAKKANDMQDKATDVILSFGCKYNIFLG